MPFDSDVALIGNGLAPLIAATHFLSQGKSVLLLNPDYDFFLEDSELPLDPLIPATIERLSRAEPERVIQELSPYFPGALETWVQPTAPTQPASGAPQFHDRLAPHVRQRGRLWVSTSPASDTHKFWDWHQLEDFYVETSDAGMNPQIWDGIQAAKRFPGYSSGSTSVTDFRGLFVPRSYDVDVTRYRNGILEFVRERLPERLVCAATQIESMPGGLRFYAEGAPRTAKINESILVFWTPRMSSWVNAQAKSSQIQLRGPSGVRMWEQWSLISRERLDASIIGMYSDMIVWAETEGQPESDGLERMAVLRAGPVIKDGALPAVTSDSFRALSTLCYDFLRWNRFSIRSMRPRVIFEWERPPGGLAETLDIAGPDASPRMHMVTGVDGPLVDVVGAVRAACESVS